MKCFNITPDLIRELPYSSKIRLADHLRIVNPLALTDRIVGSMALDDFGNMISVDAFLEDSHNG